MTGAFVPLTDNNVFFSTARSMARFGTLMLNKGNQIMTDTTYFNQMVNTSQDINKSYGYLWWLNGKPNYMVPQSQWVFNGSLCPDAPSDMYVAMGGKRWAVFECHSKSEYDMGSHGRSTQ